ncbi:MULTISPECIES: type II and III secretion system protein family protein [Oceanimonas]|uniref:Pilus assembly protein CpaC n=1 Tax=Oceanimonas doudoroffii TaxID=84158 RepID=A0A233RG19_9GAMM|nr:MULTISPECIES: type II and III secretion system protein family protein [Oceanimonas]NHI01867.1 Type IV pilus biogenesis and competence protein PilQ [Oceanimonas sp. MB9]OXY82333.1 pilus assembly protein CpaC [Oceanimonas doudoroffii]
MRAFLGSVLGLTLLVATGPVMAGGSMNEAGNEMQLPIHKSRSLMLDRPASRVSVGNPAIADVLVLQDRELYLVGKSLGHTNLMVWDMNDNLMQVYDIEVSHDLQGLKERLYRFLPNEPIQVHTSQGQLVVSGEVSNLDRLNAAYELTRGYVVAAEGGVARSEVMNMMSVGGGQQVMLEVTVAEVARDTSRSWESAFELLESSGNWGFSLLRDSVADLASFGTNTAIGSFSSADTVFNVALDLAKTRGLARVLAEPRITAISGQSAEFLSGGEYPVPVPTEDGVAVEFKEFGVGLKFTPVVLGSGKINLNLNVSVSEPVVANSANVPLFGDITALSKRSAGTTVELGDGQTISIAGLLSENNREQVSQMPFVGDIPVLGNLFTSRSFAKGESELVIMVTPRLVRPFNKEQVTLPTDGFIEPNDLEFYLLGRMSHRSRVNDGAPTTEQTGNTGVNPAMGEGGMEQTYGQSL